MHRYLIPLLALACADAPSVDDTADTDTDTPPVAGYDGRPWSDDAASLSCDGPTALAAADTLSAGDGCAAWVDGVRGRVGTNSAGSATAWTHLTEDGGTLLIGATHSLGAGWFAPVGQEVPAAVAPPPEHGVVRLGWPAADGSAPEGLSPLYDLFHAGVPADEHTQGFATILPAHDVFVALTDDQRLHDGGGAAPVPDQRRSTPADLYDPDGHLVAEPTWAAPAPDDLVMLMGYPQAGPLGGIASAAVGRVLSDAEAQAAIVALAEAGDEEGTIPYDPAVQLLIEGRSEAGMSGGGVFDADGRLVGILERASFADLGVQYVRAVRLSHVVDLMCETYGALPVADQEAVRPFLPPSVRSGAGCP